MARLFIALLLPGEIKDQVAELLVDLKPRAQGIKWVVPENLHLTLKFIGETPEEKISSIGQAMETVLVGKNKFEVTLKKYGGFPSLKNPRVLWIGLEGADPAAKIALELNQKLAAIGFEAEKRPLSPHLTLGRIKKRSDFSALTAYMDNLNFKVGSVILNRVALVESTLTPKGPIYKNLKLFKLE